MSVRKHMTKRDGRTDWAMRVEITLLLAGMIGMTAHTLGLI